MEDDPVAQKHLAKLSKYRGEYDEWGNRLTRSMLNTRHLLEGPDEEKKRRRRERKKKSKENEEDKKTDHLNLDDYKFSKDIKQLHFL